MLAAVAPTSSLRAADDRKTIVLFSVRTLHPIIPGLKYGKAVDLLKTCFRQWQFLLLSMFQQIILLIGRLNMNNKGLFLLQCSSPAFRPVSLKWLLYLYIREYITTEIQMCICIIAQRPWKSIRTVWIPRHVHVRQCRIPQCLYGSLFLYGYSRYTNLDVGYFALYVKQ